jgi:hypothetical protein
VNQNDDLRDAANSFRVYPGPSFGLIQFGFSFFNVVLFFYYFVRIRQSSAFWSPDDILFNWIYSSMCLVIFLIFAVYFFSNGIVRKITLTKEEIINQRGFPLGAQRIRRGPVYDCRIEGYETFVGGINGESGGRNNRMILVGKLGNTIADLNVNDFLAIDIRRLADRIR